MDQPRLTERGRRSLEERLRALEARIPELEAEVAASGEASAQAALGSTREEADELRRTLATAGSLEGEPHDPTVVELGDTVTVRPVGVGEPERYTIVDRLEARLDDSWISAASPMGSALLGRRAGEIVAVVAPGGAESYVVEAIDRL